ncbi:MAG: 50S ribosomal protein L3 N(5)-glutamine methyltransferase [gamma proteobacterium symbiont of Bathyaustriella thionipta]|nr:50S ribosomal protein L3 N(5)-glutamine methyltransferase [gamma proteobacterium symbiont of Bathyaustriella thionipta]MCU7950149.1 50S ribosomal protein L3 N(5)-glutamine methyltransferase [gamma proteobacterium symbiont of Bathyaustriella thionipta]MCU7952734.1 50S ribosomal protein L3 N(5)-glutamine methyltransferase [gamma proteobacterium symbiont of Bathyaustriella thionipta]MCU7957891.1 50S ribosomal protein L3 N(5)-glutamine methyltransferase [gamma proteobacterium symbiont of Bathyaus
MAEINYTKDSLFESLETITDFIRWGASVFKQAGLFFGHGNTTAIDEAAYLVLHTLNLEPDTHSVYFNSRLTDNEKTALIEILFRRAKEKIPAAYLTNESWFAGLSFYIDERVLVPRSPIAELIQKHYEPWVDANNIESILDLCTGSGCIAIANAYYFPHASVDAVDISEDALDVALQNIERHQLVDQVNIIQSDLFSNLQDKQYDIIVSNPPYVDADDMDSMPVEFHSEPEIGLAAGQDGLELVIPMLEQAAKHLSPAGILIVEVGNSDYALQQCYPDLPFYWLEFENGGQGVFLLTKEQLDDYFNGS